MMFLPQLSYHRHHTTTVTLDLAHCWTTGGQPTPNSGYQFCEPTCICSLVRQLNDMWTAASMCVSMLTRARKDCVVATARDSPGVISSLF